MRTIFTLADVMIATAAALENRDAQAIREIERETSGWMISHTERAAIDALLGSAGDAIDELDQLEGGHDD